jgi:hypothetical protein
VKELTWPSIIIALNLVAYWIVTGPWIPQHEWEAVLVAAFFMGASLGTLWMMFIAIRYESKPWHFIGLAIIPFCFVWYYYERYRSGRHLTRGRVAQTKSASPK